MSRVMSGSPDLIVGLGRALVEPDTRLAHDTVVPPDTRFHQGRALALLDLHDLGQVDPERLCNQAAAFGQYGLQVLMVEDELAKLSQSALTPKEFLSFGHSPSARLSASNAWNARRLHVGGGLATHRGKCPPPTGGKVDSHLLLWRLDFRLERLGRLRRGTSVEPRAHMTRVLNERRILLAEDEFFIAEELRQSLLDAGAVVVGPFAALQDVLQAIRAGRLDGAVLDISLRGEASYPAADLLREKGVPFVFSSGYGAEVMPERFRAAPRTGKPANLESLLKLMRSIVRP